jgi:hypothetical protein
VGVGFCALWGWGMGVGALLMSNDCSFPAERACLAPAQSTYIGRDETGSVYLPTQLERTLQLYS